MNFLGVLAIWIGTLVGISQGHPMFVLNEALKVDVWDNEYPCSWTGVYCDWDNEVTSICLTNLNFTGDLTEGAFPDLPKLEYLSIANTLFLEFPLSIPSDVCAANSLKHIEIYNFTISSFPSQLSKCTQLEIISLTFTGIDGPLPNFSVWPKLKILELDHNAITGEIPSNLAVLKDLEVVHLFNNKISGSLPTFESSVLRVLDVRENLLTGEVDVSIT